MNQETPEIPEKPYEPASSPSKNGLVLSVASLLKSIFGYGVFLIPKLVYTSGWLVTLLSMLSVSAILILSEIELGTIEDRMRREKKLDPDMPMNYAKLAGYVLGRGGRVGLEVLILLTTFFVVTFYASKTRDYISELTFLPGFLKNHKIAILLPVFLGILALTNVESVLLGSIFNVFGMVAVSICLILIITSACVHSESPTPVKIGDFTLSNISSVFTDSIFLLALHLVVVDFRQEVVSPKKTFPISIMASTFIAGVLSFVYSYVTAYFVANGLEHGGDVVSNMSDSATYLKPSALIMLSLNLFFSCVLIAKVGVRIMKNMVDAVAPSWEKKKTVKTLICSSAFLAGALLVALLTNDPSTFCGVIGGICLPVIGFIVPYVLLIAQRKKGLKVLEVARSVVAFIVGSALFVKVVMDTVKSFKATA